MKHILKVIGVGICLGVALVIIKAVFQIDKDAFWLGYLIFAAVVVVGAALFNVLYNLRYQKKTWLSR